jgi:hypothetical protein
MCKWVRGDGRRVRLRLEAHTTTGGYSLDMKPRATIRRAILCGGLVATLLLAGLWIVSGFYTIMWEPLGGSGGYVSIQGGRFGVAEPLWRDGPSTQGAFWFEPCEVPYRWWFRFGRWNGGRNAAIPLWAIMLPVLGVTSAAWRQEVNARRALKHNRCISCQYDRAGLATSAPCPECGQRTHVANSPTAA